MPWPAAIEILVVSPAHALSMTALAIGTPMKPFPLSRAARPVLAAGLLSTAQAGCVSMAPREVLPTLPVSTTWALAAGESGQSADTLASRDYCTGGAILFHGAGIDVVWKQFLSLAVIGAVLFTLSLGRFRKTITQMA